MLETSEINIKRLNTVLKLLESLDKESWAFWFWTATANKLHRKLNDKK